MAVKWCGGAVGHGEVVRPGVVGVWWWYGGHVAVMWQWCGSPVLVMWQWFGVGVVVGW